MTQLQEAESKIPDSVFDRTLQIYRRYNIVVQPLSLFIEYVLL